MAPVKTVKIIPEPKYPFKIEEVRAQKGKEIRFELKPLKDLEQAGYELIVENLKKTKGTYSDAIILKTDSKVKPEIKIHVYGDILDKPRKKKKTKPKEKSKPATVTPPTKGNSETDAPAKETPSEKKALPMKVQHKEASETAAE